MKTEVFLLSCISLLCVVTQEVTVRRDAEWPPSAFLEPLTRISKVCRKETGATEEMINRFSDKDIHDHPNLKCFMKCVLLELKAMDEDGNFCAGPVIDLIDKTEKWAQKILLRMGVKCSSINFPSGVDLCEKAFLVHKCLKEADPVPLTYYNIIRELVEKHSVVLK